MISLQGVYFIFPAAGSFAQGEEILDKSAKLFFV
jgi:hypothetical protein